MNLDREQSVMDAQAVGDMLDKAYAEGILTSVVLQFGEHRAQGCTAAEAACYTLEDFELE